MFKLLLLLLLSEIGPFVVYLSLFFLAKNVKPHDRCQQIEKGHIIAHVFKINRIRLRGIRGVNANRELCDFWDRDLCCDSSALIVLSV